MSDDDRLAALFRDAASDAGAPPPAFDHTDVLAASHRIGRRRTAMARGALAVLIVAGVGTAVVSTGQLGRNTTTSAAAPAPGAAATGGGAAQSPSLDAAAKAPGAQRDETEAGGQAPPLVVPGAPPAAAEAPPSVLAAPAPTPEQRSNTAASPAPMAAQGAQGYGPPLGPGNTDCADRQDPAVRTYLDQALPEVAGAPDAPTTKECRSGGERGVSVEVSAGGAEGVLEVRYLPPGAARPATPSGTRAAEAATASGGTVIVSSRPATAGGSAPFADRLDAVVAYLAPRL